MRTKQTARKSTARTEGDPMQSRLRILETKRSSLGPNASSFVKQSHREGSSGRHSLPAPRTIGNNGRGKQLPFLDEIKHKPKLKHGDNILREISRLRKTTQLLIPRAPFHRIVREITQNIDGAHEHKYQMAALMALQEAAEAYLASLFEDAYLLTLHAKRVTLFAKDIELCRRLRRE